MAGLIDPSQYVIGEVRHDNVPTPGESHLASECPGPTECVVAEAWVRLAKRLTRERP